MVDEKENKMDFLEDFYEGKFVENYIECVTKSNLLVSYHKFLKNKIDNVKIDYIENDLANILEDGFYNDFFGVSRDIALSDIVGKVKDTCFINFVIAGKSQIDKIINFGQGNLPNRFLRQNHKPCNNGEVDIKDIMNKDELFSMIKDYLNCMIRLTINCNRQTKFLFTLHKITRSYLEYAYPDLKDKDKFEKLKEVIGLKILSPILNRVIKDELYYLPEESFGGLIYNLNEMIWEFFVTQNYSSSIPNSRINYFIDAESLLGKRQLDIKQCSITPNGYIEFSYHILGKKFSSKEYNRNGVYPGTSTLYSYGGGNCNISMVKVFKDISPLLFLGLMDLKFPDNESIQFDKIEFDKSHRYFSFCCPSWVRRNVDYKFK